MRRSQRLCSTPLFPRQTGVHWIYIQDDVAKAVKGEPNTDGPPTSKEAIFAKINAQKDGWEGNPKFKEPLDLELVTEFVEPSACPWYKVSAGALRCEPLISSQRL